MADCGGARSRERRKLIALVIAAVLEGRVRGGGDESIQDSIVALLKSKPGTWLTDLKQQLSMVISTQGGTESSP
jgi:hypothetical protein